MKFSLCLLYFTISTSLSLTQEKRGISFSKDIFPIVKSRCLKCHEKDDENPSGYAMETVEMIKQTGTTENIVIPGNAAKSILILKLLPNPPKGAQMPIFSKKKLTEEEIDLFRQWIDQGAKDN